MNFKRQGWHVDILGGVFIVIVTLTVIWIENNRPGTHTTTDIIIEHQSDTDAAGKPIKKFDTCKDGTVSVNGECPEGQSL